MIAFLHGPLVCLFVCLFVSLFVYISPWSPLVHFVSYYAVQINSLSIILKLYIERNNVQVELIRFCKQNYLLYSRLRLRCNIGSLNATPDSVYFTSRWSHLSHIVHHSVEWCAGVFLSSTVVFTQLRYYANGAQLVNIMKVYIERNNMQLELKCVCL